MLHRRLDRLVSIAGVAAFVALPVGLFGGVHRNSSPPPDLRLEWPRPQDGATPVRGRAGEAVDVGFRLRNVGGTDAFAVVLEARTALGPLTSPQRLQPGPRAGAAFDRVQRFALAAGMRELCLDARLQSVEPDAASDPTPHDNRICRPIEITPVGASVGRDFGAPRAVRPVLLEMP